MKKYYSNNFIKQNTARKPLITMLEPRLLLDGAAAVTVADVFTDTQLQDEASEVDSTSSETSLNLVIAPTEVRALDASLNNGKKEVVFIEDNATDYQVLIDNIEAGIEVVLLDSTQDGLSQMLLWAENNSDYDAIHLITHGSEGQVDLGSMSLNSDTIESRTTDLQRLGAALNEMGDLLLYGCDVAGAEGEQFIQALASVTQADVASSDDLTGTADLGGDWALEVESGTVESSSLRIEEFNQVLATSTIVFVAVTQNGNYAVNVSERGINIAVTTENAINRFKQIDSTVGGANGNMIADTQGDGLTKVIFTFDTTIDITSMQLIEIIDKASGTYIFTNTTSGSSESVAINAADSTEINGTHGFLATLNLTNVDSMEVTYSADGSGSSEDEFSPGFDSLVFEASSNEVPTISGVPTDITVTEDVASNVDLSAVTLADTNGDDLTVTLTASVGTLAATSTGSVTVAGTSSAMTLSGTAANINTFLDSTSNITYTSIANDNGEDAATLTIKANDGTIDSAASTVNLDITAVNDTPTLTGAPTDITVTEDVASNVDLSAITFADVDGDNLTVTLTASTGTLSATSTGSVTVAGTSSAMTLSGTAANINTFLDSTSNITYTSATNANGDDATTLTITANDATVDSATSTVNVDITAKDTSVIVVVDDNTGLFAETFAVDRDNNLTEAAIASLRTLSEISSRSNVSTSFAETVTTGSGNSVVVNVETDGSVQVTQAVEASKETTGLSISSITSQSDFIHISIVDKEMTGSYSATLANGTSLPSWITVSPTTGEITIESEQAEGVINIRFIAISTTGEIRVLEIELDLDNLPVTTQKAQDTVITSVTDLAFMPLDAQLGNAVEQFDGYGSNVMKLLAS